MGNDVTRLKEARNRIGPVLTTIEQMRGVPRTLAGEAWDRTRHVLAPLRELEHIELPPEIIEAGRAAKAAAKEFAADPTDESLERWAYTLRSLASVQDVYGRRLREAARKAQTPPATFVNIGDMSAGRMAQTELEKQGHRFVKQGVQR